MREDIKHNLKINGFDNNNTIKPIVLFSYSLEGRTEFFEVLQKRLNEDYFLQYMM